MDTDALADARGQIWAEAVARYRAGEAWHLEDDALVEAQKEAMAERYDGDAWTERVMESLEGRSTTTTGAIMSGCLQLPVREQSRAAQMRVGGILRAAGWTRKRRIIDGKPLWVFSRPDSLLLPGDRNPTVIPFPSKGSEDGAEFADIESLL